MTADLFVKGARVVKPDAIVDQVVASVRAPDGWAPPPPPDWVARLKA